MDNKEVEEILKEYKLSEEEHDELYDMIKEYGQQINFQ